MINLKDALILQKRELEVRLKESYLERIADTGKLKNPLIKVIIGPRRAGKSFFAIHFLSKQANFGYINFDDEKLIEVRDYEELITAINSVYKNPKTVLFDEVQNLPKWELLVNRLQRQGLDIIITGSNANLLSKELATHLTGRHISINIFPFSFKEYLGKEELTTAETKEHLDTFIVYGGYPEPLIKKIEYKEYLSTLFNSTIYKDIVKRYRIRSPQGMEDLAYYLLSNIANEYSYKSLSKTTRIQSPHTVEKYLKYLEESFIFFSLKRFSYKIKEQLSSNKKIYSIDNGFIYAKAFKISPDFGRLYENAVAQELKKEEFDNKIKLFYWKNQQQEEVDFVVQQNTTIKQLIQVCFDIKNVKTKEREVRALLKAGEDTKCKNLLVITEDYEAEEKTEWFGIKGKVKFVPLWKWLINK